MGEGERLRCVGIVEGSDDRGLDEFLEEALRRRDRVRVLRISRDLFPRFDGDHQRIVGTVVAAFELQDPPASRHGPGEADGEQGRVEPGHRELEAVDLVSVAHVVRERPGVHGLVSEDRAVRHPLPHRLREDRMAVARDERAEGHVEIDVLVPVRVPHPGAARVSDVQRIRVHEPIVAIHAGRNATFRGLPGPRGLLRPPAIGLEFFLPGKHDIV